MSLNPQGQKPEPYVDIRTVSDMLGVSYNTLRRWDANGKLPADRTPTGKRRWLLSTVKYAVREATAREWSR